ncbi:protein EMBRYO SAC DEVELOPMENT ARREST 30 isoform X2 [Populus alba]|uniref:protein EMBRYO SAC DEVELOPMENT ARREST 30 isoform X2 n=1 Tax=Populus alba TaxID=43335 RepID=UPI00158C44BF|nr:protein EMBRYO SAC DEVELOPMENT ARREST 30-like isoform X2 [Populus alba]
MKMAFKSKIKWIALFVLILSMVSLVIHLSITKLSGPYSLQSTLMPAIGFNLTPIFDGDRAVRNKRSWGHVKSLKSLQPYANPRSSYPVPNEKSNGYIYAKIFGGFEKIRSSICDLVTISRLLNATLVIPEIQESLQSKGISYKFKSFSYLYDEEQFIASLKNDVIIVNSLPENLKAGRRRNEIHTYKPKSSASPNFYVKEILPELKKSKVIGLVLHDGGCLQSILPPSMSEFQRLRCRVAFHALKFRPKIQVLGQLMVQRLRASGQPFLAFHPGLVRNTLAYHGCAELYQDVHTELIQYRRAQMIKQGILNDKLSVDSHVRRSNGSCPLMPEEIGLLLKEMGYSTETMIYVAGSETFGGQRILIPLRANFSNTVDRTQVCTKQELSDLVGPETPLPLNPFQPPPTKTEEQLKEEWNRAGPRPRPLLPPPDRPIYQHEKEVEADAFFPGFHNDGSGWPDFSSLVMGHRLYESASSKTYRPDRRVLAELFNVIHDNLYHHNNRTWKRVVREHLNKSLSEDGLIRQSLLSKPTTFLSHPLPECSCRIPSAEVRKQVKGNDGRFLYGGEDECPRWMQLSQEDTRAESAVVEEEGSDDNSEPEYENVGVEQQESDDSRGRSGLTQIPMDQDDEWDPND